MVENTKIDEQKIWEKDVKTMSYEDLMDAIRYLDKERETLSKEVYNAADEQNNKFSKQEKINRAA